MYRACAPSNGSNAVECEVLYSQSIHLVGNGLPPGVQTQETALPTDLSAYSRLRQRVRRRYAESLAVLAPGLPGKDHFIKCYAALQEKGFDTASALRICRMLVLDRLIELDCDADCSLSDVTGVMTALAQFALAVAMRHALEQLDALHGMPQRQQTPAPSPRAHLLVVGMGKLGARELNVSSDIDLIFLYDEDGETQGLEYGRGSISNHEYFAKAVRAISGLLTDTTEHGFVFRVDLALRPNGNSGPPALSLDALEEYFFTVGREWERFAWLKSRIVACSDSALLSGHAGSTELAIALRKVVLPFVFRRYLDYGVFEALRQLHAQIRDHAAKRAAGRPHRSNDIKLSRGGIREIEFIVQLLQVVRGGQFPELRTRATLDALQRLVRAQLMPITTAGALAQAYTFLRRLEHRIQYLDDQQTHILPVEDADLEWLAHTLGFEGSAAFLSQLNIHREMVANEFDRLLGGADEAADRGNATRNATRNGTGKTGCKSCSPDETESLESILLHCPPAFAQRVNTLNQHPRVLALRDDARERLRKVALRTAHWLADGSVSEQAALRIADWIEPLLKRESYLALLLERPAVHLRLLRLLGTARWPARYLLKHPGVIDELATEAMVQERFNAVQFIAELTERERSLRSTEQDDEESLMLLLRRAHHAEVFRILARDVEGRIGVEQVADDLSALADAVLDVTLRWCWQRMRQRHCDAPRLAIVAYGKLGGKELGYGSDLDIVFVYDDPHEQAATVYAALVRKLIAWLSSQTAQGDLYEIDTALRPNGSSGLLVTSIDAFEAYQSQRGSNTAWVWEHQAMTRARCVWGAPELRERFDAVRQTVLCAPRDLVKLALEIATMRERVRQAHRPSAAQGVARFDIKHGAGGMVDVEFAVQYLVLAYARDGASLQDNVGNIALLERAEAAALVPKGVGHNAADAYRALRRAQHLARLNEESTLLDATAMASERAAVLALWRWIWPVQSSG